MRRELGTFAIGAAVAAAFALLAEGRTVSPVAAAHARAEMVVFPLQSGIAGVAELIDDAVARLAVRVDQHQRRLEEHARLIAELQRGARTDAPAASPAASGPTALGRELPAWTQRAASPGLAWVARSGAAWDSELRRVVPGDVLPGAGRVLSVERVDGRWVVRTERGHVGLREAGGRSA
jgi:hypothetical protein